MAKLVKRLVVTGISLLAFGILLCIISMALGVNYKDVQWGAKSNREVESINQVFEGPVNNLQLSICSGTLEVKRGNSLQLIGERIPKGTLHYSLESGILKIDDGSRKNNGLHFSLFGINIGGFNTDKKITLYIPKEVSFDSFDIEMNAGTSKLEDITAKTAKIVMDAGKLDAKNITVTKQTTLSMDAGKMDLKQVSLRDSSVEVNAGKCTIDGTLYGETIATLSAGKMELKTGLKESEYAFKTDVTAGNVKINGKTYHEEETHHDAENSMFLNCSAGTIKVETE